MTQVDPERALDTPHGRDEAIIERGLDTFLEVGWALWRIRERGSYRPQYATFDAYCKDRWQIGSRQALDLIDAASISSEIEAADLPTPPNVFVASRLRPIRANKQKMLTAWKRALELNAGRMPAAHDVSDVVRAMLEPPARGTHASASQMSPEGIAFEKALESVKTAIDGAKGAQRQAMRDVDADTLDQWISELGNLRMGLRQVRAGVVRTRKVVGRRPQG